MNLGKSIRKLRKQKDISQIEFAAMIGMSQSYLSLVEKEHRKPSTDMVEKVASALEIPLPLMLWFAIEEKDVAEDKKEHFKIIKPLVDKMLEDL